MNKHTVRFKKQVFIVICLFLDSIITEDECPCGVEIEGILPPELHNNKYPWMVALRLKVKTPAGQSLWERGKGGRPGRMKARILYHSATLVSDRQTCK